MAPLELLHSITSPWPFHTRGVDILGHFPLVVGQLKFLIVFVDYFTKWVEAEPVAMISIERRKIICQFWLSSVIVLDNGTQFASWLVTDFCSKLGIRQSCTSVEHPQSNGQAESTNKVILRGLRRRVLLKKRAKDKKPERGDRPTIPLSNKNLREVVDQRPLPPGNQNLKEAVDERPSKQQRTSIQ
ncbi:Pol polyprotein, partial [Mucuna pruriens]